MKTTYSLYVNSLILSFVNETTYT